MLNAKITRSDLVIALGGGVIGDLAGFAAPVSTRSTAGSDSHLPSCTGRLFRRRKSRRRPATGQEPGRRVLSASMVLIDPMVLDTLNERFINDGMGEVIKYGCIKDADLFHTLESHGSFEKLKEELPAIILRCVDIKRMVVENDQYDTGERMLLNFGHTLGHTIEQHFNYQRESHGEAVAIGMFQITKLAQEQCLTAPGTAKRILDVLQSYGLPYECGLPLQD